jgi:hypothetical protein
MSGKLRAAWQDAMSLSLCLVKPRAVKCLVVATLVSCGFSAAAQQPEDAHPYTIHVYTNLMEIPALVLDSSDEPLKHVDTSRFAISLDSGPNFPPTYVRLEGDDPISLAVLLDLSDEEIARELPILRNAIPALAPESLHSRDHVSLYTMDCALVRSANDMVASNAAMTEALDAAIDHPGLHGPKNKPTRCSGKSRLWDSLGTVATDLGSRPGRKVIVLVSNGLDGRSGLRWNDLRRFAASRGIAIFGITFDLDTSVEYLKEDYLIETLCRSTGGTVLHLTSEHDLRNAFPNVMKLVRGRYILQFHRPGNATRGLHDVAVTLKHTVAHIRVAGTTVPLPSAEESSGPDGLPPAPTTSVIGTRHPVFPQ